MQNQRNTPKEVFLHLLAMATLYMGVVNILQILWQAINKWLPDAASQGMYGGYVSYSSDLVRFAIASLLIVYPVYLISTIFLRTIYTTSEGARESKLRRWLTYVTLLIASLVLIGDLITVLHAFLQGELTLRFFLKALSVVGVIGGVWAYYFLDIRGIEGSKSRPVNKPLAYIVSLKVLVVIVLGFFVTGSPWHERLVRLDGIRVNNLSNIQMEITDFYRSKATVPGLLADLPQGMSYAHVDPESGKTYEYRKISNESFELCADFVTDSTTVLPGQVIEAYPIEGLKNNSFSHATGHVCFTRVIDPDYFKPPIR